ncbi:hypothetical protein K1X84_08485 [bacterium]|nr:hypothetical protein [bacterium]
MSQNEGYIYTAYGEEKYLHHAAASAKTLRRYDQQRPIALVCESSHRDILQKNEINVFDQIVMLNPKHTSIVGFKHNVHEYMIFEKNLFLDSDMIWCRDPDSLWTSLSVHPFTITGKIVADNFFGGPKNAGIVADILFRRRQRTLQRFGLTYLSRVQSGMIFAQDTVRTRDVCLKAQEILSRKHETHFRSRKQEKGRNEESCEWSLAMAMSSLNIPVYPWFQAHSSPQLDYIKNWTMHDSEFAQVECLYFGDETVYSFRGLKSERLKKLLIKLWSYYPGKGDKMKVTPYVLHFGWHHEKQPFLEFAEKQWNAMIGDKP